MGCDDFSDLPDSHTRAAAQINGFVNTFFNREHHAASNVASKPPLRCAFARVFAREPKTPDLSLYATTEDNY